MGATMDRNAAWLRIDASLNITPIVTPHIGQGTYYSYHKNDLISHKDVAPRM